MLMTTGFLILILGVWLVLRAGKNEFDRTDYRGNERFKNYTDLAVKRTLDWILRFAGFLIFMIGGGMMFIANVSPK